MIILFLAITLSDYKVPKNIASQLGFEDIISPYREINSKME